MLRLTWIISGGRRGGPAAAASSRVILVRVALHISDQDEWSSRLQQPADGHPRLRCWPPGPGPAPPGRRRVAAAASPARPAAPGPASRFDSRPSLTGRLLPGGAAVVCRRAATSVGLASPGGWATRDVRVRAEPTTRDRDDADLKFVMAVQDFQLVAHS